MAITLALNARTAVGVTEGAATLVLLAAENDNTSQGLTVAEAATILVHDYHVFDALNLDGDGSTSLVIEDSFTGFPLTLVPSSFNPVSARAVGSNLAVFAPPFPKNDSLSVFFSDSGTLICSWKTPSGYHLERSFALTDNDWKAIDGAIQLDGVSAIEVQMTNRLAFFRLAN